MTRYQSLLSWKESGAFILDVSSTTRDRVDETIKRALAPPLPYRGCRFCPFDGEGSHPAPVPSQEHGHSCFVLVYSLTLSASSSSSSSLPEILQAVVSSATPQHPCGSQKVMRIILCEMKSEISPSSTSGCPYWGSGCARCVTAIPRN